MDSVAIFFFASQPIVPTNILNMLIVGILATVSFQLEYTKCHVRPLNDWDWWAKKVLL